MRTVVWASLCATSVYLLILAGRWTQYYVDHASAGWQPAIYGTTGALLLLASLRLVRAYWEGILAETRVRLTRSNGYEDEYGCWRVP